MPYSLVFKILGPLLLVAALMGWAWTGGKANERKVWQLKEAAQVREQLAAQEQARATELALQAKVTEANNALILERAEHARVAAGLKRDADKLRGAIARFAGGGANDTLAACNTRATTLGVVLDRVLSDYQLCTARAEAAAGDLRAVIKAWPKRGGL